jgi:Undecaprenyl-phosphate glucose phosphotransferase
MATLTSARDGSRRPAGFVPRAARFVPYHGFGFFVPAVDALLIVASAEISGAVYGLRVSGHAPDYGFLFGYGSLVAALMVAVVVGRRSYAPSALVDVSAQARRIAVDWTLVFAFTFAIGFFLKTDAHYSRGALLGFYLLGYGALAAWRLALHKLVTISRREGQLRGHPSVVVGGYSHMSGSALMRHLGEHGYDVHHTFALRPGQDRGDVASVTEAVIEYVRSHEIHEILLAVSWREDDALAALLEGLRVLPVRVVLLPDMENARILAHPVVQLGSTLAVEVKRAALTPGERFAKRSLDVVGASIALLMLAPLLAVVALLIRMDSPGPVIFKQSRGGYGSRPFKIFKFRTMTVLEDGPQVRQAARVDTRVTAVGRWLRSMSVDELPQIINVLRGEMSLVGPRPHALAHDDEFQKAIDDYAFRHHVKPGITGWSQVNGLRGETPVVDLMRRRVEHDIWYINNYSFWLDLVIIARTAWDLVRSRAF